MKFSFQEFVNQSLRSGCKQNDFTPEICFNAGVLIAKINMLGYQPSKVFTSCLRSKEKQIAVYKAKGITDIKKIPMGSAHLSGCAVDIEDADGKLKAWLLKNENKLAELGLYVEHPDYCKGWAHLQSVPPKSGKRFFIP